jgi:hypothetical protein
VASDIRISSFLSSDGTRNIDEVLCADAHTVPEEIPKVKYLKEPSETTAIY